MTLDEAIKHCLEVAEDNETKAQKIGVQFLGTTKDKEATDCRECAADHRQLAEWLKELKSLRKKAEHLTEWNRKLIDYKNEIICKWGESQEELQEAKRLLKLAVEDIESLRPYLAEPYSHMCNEKWRYADEAKKLLDE